MSETNVNAYKIELAEAETELVRIKARITDLKSYISDNGEVEGTQEPETEETVTEEVVEKPTEVPVKSSK